MNRKSFFAVLGNALLLLSLTAATTSSAHAQGKLVQRNVQEWLDAQGTALPYDPLLPQTPRLIGWINNPDINGDSVDSGPRYRLWYDYAGVLGRASSYGGLFGPSSIVGTVTERAIGGGMAEVTVRLHVTGALIWVTLFGDGSGVQYRTGPTVFGHRETELLAHPDLEPARADVDFTTSFLNPVGAPMPDILPLAINNAVDHRWLGFHVVLNAAGPLTEVFGVPEGTPGVLHWGKPGLLSSPANANADNGAASGFPNDQFHLFPVGGK